LNISDLTPAQLRSRFHGDGLRFRSGDFAVRVQTTLKHVIDGIALLYADYPLSEDGAEFADFHIRLDSPPNLHRFFKPQVRFMLDGRAPFKPLPLDQAFPMFEWGLNWCVSTHANSFLMIHAAVIEKHGHAAILPAPPGSGKSTLCAALVGRGWRLLSDELTLIRIGDRAIVPLPRPVSLKNKSIDIIRDFQPGAVISRPVLDTMKGTVAHVKPPSASIARANETCRPGWIIFPRYVAGAGTSMAPLGRSRAFIRVADNAFNYSVLGGDGFNALADVVGESQC
jgi:HprK-related kinase A